MNREFLTDFVVFALRNNAVDWAMTHLRIISQFSLCRDKIMREAMAFNSLDAIEYLIVEHQCIPSRHLVRANPTMTAFVLRCFWKSRKNLLTKLMLAVVAQIVLQFLEYLNEDIIMRHP